MAGNDLQALADMFAGLGPRLEHNLTRAVRIVATKAVAEAKTHHAYTDRTGFLTNSIEASEPTGSALAGDLSATISAGAAYAEYVEKGTRPHVIRPRYRKALRWPVDGGFAFAKEVHHPGTAATHFLELAVEHVVPEFAERLVPQAIELSFIQAGFSPG